MTESQLIQGCKKKKSHAQKTLYDKYANSHYRLCYRYLGNNIDAEDAMVIAFNKILVNIGKFEYQNFAGFKSWMKKIMVNECLMLLRKRNRFDHNEIHDDNHPSNNVNYIEFDAEIIYQCIADLKESQRTIFNLFVIDGYSHKEIASELKISISTSMSQLSRAKKLLQEKLKEFKSDYDG